MPNNYQKIEMINRRFVELAKKHNMNPVWLREIIELRNRGFNYSQIAERTGISRETVANYLQKFGAMDRRDTWLLIVGAGLILCGVGLIGYFLGKDKREGPSSKNP